MNDKNSIYRDTVLKFYGLIKISYVQECFFMGGLGGEDAPDPSIFTIPECLVIPGEPRDPGFLSG